MRDREASDTGKVSRGQGGPLSRSWRAAVVLGEAPGQDPVGERVPDTKALQWECAGLAGGQWGGWSEVTGTAGEVVEAHARVLSLSC